MNDSLTDDLLQQLQGKPLSTMGQQLDLSDTQTTGAVSAALPLLLGALGRNASQPQGAESLFGALQRDHNGLDLGNVLGTVMGGGGQGGQILEHIFGGRKQGAAQGLGAATGLGGDRANTLLKILAPIVMAYLAKRMFANRAATTPTAETGPTPQVLGDVLGQEQQRIRQQGGPGGDLLGSVFDRDGDGQVGLSDLLSIGGSVLGGRHN